MDDTQCKIENGVAVITVNPPIPAPITTTYTLDEVCDKLESLHENKQRHQTDKANAINAIADDDTQIAFWHQVKVDLGGI